MYPALFIIVELGFVFTQLSPSPYLFTSNVSSIRYSGLLLLCTRAGSVYRNVIVLSYCNDMLMGGGRWDVTPSQYLQKCKKVGQKSAMLQDQYFP